MGAHDLQRGLDALRRALSEVLAGDVRWPEPLLVTAGAVPGRPVSLADAPWLLTQTSHEPTATATGTRTAGHDDSALATSSLQDQAEGSRLIALVELARNGDSEAFGQLYDHYHSSVYRFLYYR